MKHHFVLLERLINLMIYTVMSCLSSLFTQRLSSITHHHDTLIDEHSSYLLKEKINHLSLVNLRALKMIEIASESAYSFISILSVEVEDWSVILSLFIYMSKFSYHNLITIDDLVFDMTHSLKLFEKEVFEKIDHGWIIFIILSQELNSWRLSWEMMNQRWLP